MCPGSCQGFKQIPGHQGKLKNILEESFVDRCAFESIIVCWEGRSKRRCTGIAVSNLHCLEWLVQFCQVTTDSGIKKYAHNVPDCHEVSGLTCSNVCRIDREAVEDQVVLVREDEGDQEDSD